MNTQNTKSREQLLQEVAHLQRRVAELEASVEPLQASEARIRAVLANNAIVVFDHDQELRYTRIYNPNPNFTVEGVVGKMDADLFLPDDAARLTGIKRRVLATGMGERQAIQTTLGGETFYYDLTVESRLDEAGQVVGLTCAAMDITERKQTEKALRENEERLALIIKGAELGTWDWHIPGGELVVNERWAEMLGYTLAEVEPHINTWEKLIHPADAERVLQNTQAHVNGQIPLFQEEYRVSAKSGEWKWILDTGKVMAWDEQGRPVRAAGIHQDITARKQAELALQASEARFATIFQASPLSISIVGLKDHQFVDVNQAWITKSGFSREETIGRTPLELNLWVNPDERAQFLTQLSEYGSVHGLEAQFRLKSGAVADVLISAELVDIAGERCMLVITQNITERKRIEADLADERAFLARRVEERTAELSQANAELTQALRVKNEFMSTMTHELRTPLTGILGMAEVMQEQLFGPLNEHQFEQIRLIEVSGQRLLALVNNILDLTYLETGKVELKAEMVSVGEICRVSVQSVSEAAHKKSLTLSCRLPDQPLYLQTAPHRLRQILVNLLDNAVKFTPAGGQVGLEVIPDPAAEMIYLTVQDNGIGLKPEQMERLFQPFTQLDSSLARSYEGAGLGLVLVRRLAELHHGTVSVQSEGTPGLGSRFTVSLPWRAPHP